MTGLHADQLRKSFPAPGGELTVLRDASLHLEPGQNTAILGPSGSGKSTLLAILGTLETPTGGTLTLDGEDPFALGEADLARFRNRRIGYVFQDHHLLPQCTVLQNVLVPYLADGGAGKDEIAHAESLIQRVGLSERRLHRPAELSGGERQRVAIARALVRGPALVLADEPTGNLDGATADAIVSLLLEMHADLESVLVVVTHSEDLALRMQSRRRLTDGTLS